MWTEFNSPSDAFFGGGLAVVIPISWRILKNKQCRINTKLSELKRLIIQNQPEALGVSLRRSCSLPAQENLHLPKSGSKRRTTQSEKNHQEEKLLKWVKHEIKFSYGTRLANNTVGRRNERWPWQAVVHSGNMIPYIQGPFTSTADIHGRRALCSSGTNRLVVPPVTCRLSS